MAGVINHLVLVLVILCTLITISTAQKSLQKESDDSPKNQTETSKMANLQLFQKDVSIRHSTLVPSLRFPVLTKRATRLSRRKKHYHHHIRVPSSNGHAQNLAKTERPRKNASRTISDAPKKYELRMLYNSWLRDQEDEDEETRFETYNYQDDDDDDDDDEEQRRLETYNYLMPVPWFHLW